MAQLAGDTAKDSEEPAQVDVRNLINVVTRRDKRWDLTAAASYTLSDQTVKVLGNLKTPVKVLVFDTPGGFQRFRDSLTMYTTASSGVRWVTSSSAVMVWR